MNAFQRIHRNVNKKFNEIPMIFSECGVFELMFKWHKLFIFM